ncbi:MAG: diacylglycerol/polyprenol kinase family protein [Polyangiaceae bacterium]
MTATLAATAAPHVIELYETLRELDPVRFRREMAERLSAKLVSLGDELERLGEAVVNESVNPMDASEIAFGLEAGTAEAESELRVRIAQLAVTLKSLSDRGEVSRERWSELRASLLPAYEALARVLRLHAVHVPSLRPTNWHRSVFHTGSGLAALACAVWLADWVPYLASAFFLSAFTMETMRRVSPRANRLLMGLFSRVAHPHEAHRINSATWYATALVLLAFFAEPWMCAIAVTVLAFADPAAGLVGRRIGRIRLVHGRSLEGSLTFVLVGAISAFAVLAIFYSGTPHALRIALGAAVCGGLAELFSRRLDDNLTVPLAAAFGAWLMA